LTIRFAENALKDGEIVRKSSAAATRGAGADAGE
jgi:hypothetical protein